MSSILVKKGYCMELTCLIAALTAHYKGNKKKAYGSLGGSITCKFVEYITRNGRLYVRRIK